jgi:hypothetical protein
LRTWSKFYDPCLGNLWANKFVRGDLERLFNPKGIFSILIIISRK